MLPLTIGKVCKKMFYKKEHDSKHHKITFLSPKTHTYIHLPAMWGYTNIDSFTQPSGDTPKGYIIHPRHSGQKE